MKKEELKHHIRETIKEVRKPTLKEHIQSLIMELLLEDRYSELEKKYVGDRPDKISKSDFDAFFEATKSNPIAMKYSDNILYLLLNFVLNNHFLKLTMMEFLLHIQD